ncbi:hypothetical protein DC498_06295 [Terrimonas sp.]|uniref:glycosyltransferase n=1 Tax=Terrimonas sp. TaxID=1914338 RepID=UPI000D51329D|nr:glycosyltransferase [Terrimonas sp.]PVD52974.1 hypothetical protein DC498_06295 [Terrimonas sp.]
MPVLSISIVLPFYKPLPGRKLSFLQNIAELERKIPPKICLAYVVVNDGTEDEDAIDFFEEISKHYNLRYVCYKHNRGKGHALRAGVALSNVDYIVLSDFDFPFGTDNIVEVINQLLMGYEVVLAERDEHYFRNLPAKRRLISKWYMKLSKLSLRLSVDDVQAGIKGFNNKGRKIFLETRIDRFLIDTEFVLRAAKNNLSFKVIKVSLREGIYFSDFGARTLLTEFRNFIAIVRTIGM